MAVHQIPICISSRNAKPSYRYLRSRNPSNLVHINLNKSAFCRPVANTVHSTKFTYLNVGSIKNKTTSFYDYIVQNEVDVMAVCETWLYPDELSNSIFISELRPQGY